MNREVKAVFREIRVVPETVITGFPENVPSTNPQPMPPEMLLFTDPKVPIPYTIPRSLLLSELKDGTPTYNNPPPALKFFDTLNPTFGVIKKIGPKSAGSLNAANVDINSNAPPTEIWSVIPILKEFKDNRVFW